MTEPGHPDDALSALLDGELTADDERAVRAHVRACDRCARELDAVARVRSRLRGLPPVDPPFGLFERLLLGRRRRAAIAAWAASAAAAAAVAAFAVPDTSRVDPPLPALVERHAASHSVTGDPVSQLAPAVVVNFEER